MKIAITEEDLKTFAASAVYLLFPYGEYVCTVGLLEHDVAPLIPIATLLYALANMLWADSTQSYIYLLRKVRWNSIFPLSILMAVLSVVAGVGACQLDKQWYELEWTVKYKTW